MIPYCFWEQGVGLDPRIDLRDRVPVWKRDQSAVRATLVSELGSTGQEERRERGRGIAMLGKCSCL